MMNQKDGVTNAILSVLNERGVDYVMGGEVCVKNILTSEDKANIRAIVINGFKSGLISITEQAKAKHTDNGFVKYTNGLVNNWINKNPEFNAGQSYTPKNPGSRAGSGDEQIREMRKLLKTTDDQEQIDLIQSMIDARLAEIKPASVVTINVDALPESLKHLVKA